MGKKQPRLLAWLTRGIGVMSLALVLGQMPAWPLWAAPGQVLVVRNDPGGLIGARSRALEVLRASGQRVELRGYCSSACTLYLGLENICVTASARFGFHGPSWYGAPLDADAFELWSQVMARAYVPALRDWYLTKARYELGAPLIISGRELIKMGYPAC